MNAYVPQPGSGRSTSAPGGHAQVPGIDVVEGELLPRQSEQVPASALLAPPSA